MSKCVDGTEELLAACSEVQSRDDQSRYTLSQPNRPVPKTVQHERKVCIPKRHGSCGHGRHASCWVESHPESGSTPEHKAKQGETIAGAHTQLHGNRKRRQRYIPNGVRKVHHVLICCICLPCVLSLICILQLQRSLCSLCEEATARYTGPKHSSTGSQHRQLQ